MVAPTGRPGFCSCGPQFGDNAPTSDKERRRELQLFSSTGALRGRRFALLATGALVFAAPGARPARADDDLDSMFSKDVLIVVASERACYRFDVYLALTPAQRARGLMYVRDLPATTGMLFAYANADYITMWMKNTYIPLDMVFARADGTVARVARDTEPLSLRSIAAPEPVNFVLELNAGTADRLSIDEDSYLLWEPAPGD